MNSQQHNDLEKTQRMREALEQTVSARDFSSAAMESLAEHMRNSEDKVSFDLVRNLLDTVEAENFGSETDFRLETEDVSLAESSYDKNSSDGEDGVGRYKVLGHLGTGAAGQVFEVQDLNFDRKIAVKFLHPQAADRSDRMFDFINEAKLSAQLEHPNILPIHDVNISDSGMLYFSMQKASGKSLKDLLDDFQDEGHLSKDIRDINDRVTIIMKVCDAIAYAHSRGIVHQDIKPSNIMIGQYGEVVIVDWGTATYVDEARSGRGELVGTPIYMAPEQARREQPDYTSDIYCLGSTLFHILLLRFPTWSDNLDTFWEMKKQGIINPVTRDERKHVPGPLLSIVLKAMDPEPGLRYKSVRDLLTDLKAFQSGQKVKAHRDSIVDIWKRLYRHNKRAVWVAAVGLVFVAILGLVLYNELLKSQSEWNVYAVEDFDDMQAGGLSEDWTGLTLRRYNSNTMSEHVVGQGEMWSIADGRLRYKGPGISDSQVNLTYRHKIPGDIRIEFDYYPGRDGSIPKMYLGGKHRYEGYVTHLVAGNSRVSGYITREPVNEERLEVQYRGSGNLTQGAVPVDITAGERYHIRYERQGNYIRMYINGFELFNVYDVDVLTGPQYQQFGIEVSGGYDGVHTFDNFVISNRPLAQKVSPLTVADTYFRLGDYEQAVAYYEALIDAYPGTDVRAFSLYRMGRCLIRSGEYARASMLLKIFLNEFPEHDLHNYVLYELGRSYAQNDNISEAKVWFGKISVDAHENVRQQTLIAILYYYTRSYPDVGKWNPVILDHPEQIFGDLDVVKYLYKIEGEWDYWSDKLQITLYRSHPVWMSIPYMHLRMGNFDHLIKRYKNVHFHYAVFDALRLLGQGERIKEFHPNEKGLYRNVLLDTGQYERYLAEFSANESAMKRYWWHTGEFDKYEELEGSLSKSRKASILIRQQRYTDVIQQYPDQDWQLIDAYRGLGQFENITPERFPAHKKEVEFARIMAGDERGVIAESYPTQRWHVRATCSLLLKALQAGDHELASEYITSLEQRPFDYWRTSVEDISIDRFIIPLFARYLLDEGDVDKEAFFGKVKQVLEFRENNRILYIHYIVKALTEDDPELPLKYARRTEDEFLTGMRYEVLGQTSRAMEFYRRSVEEQAPHKYNVLTRFAQWRLKVLDNQ